MLYFAVYLYCGFQLLFLLFFSYLVDYKDLLKLSTEDAAISCDKVNVVNPASVEAMSISENGLSSISSQPELAENTKNEYNQIEEIEIVDEGDSSHFSNLLNNAHSKNLAENVLLNNSTQDGVHHTAIKLNYGNFNSSADNCERIEMRSLGFEDDEGSDKENLASNFGSRLSLISNNASSSLSSNNDSKKPKKCKRKRRTTRMGLDRFKRISSIGKTASRIIVTNKNSPGDFSSQRKKFNPLVTENFTPAEKNDGLSVVPLVDIEAYSKEVEDSIDKEEEVSSERELIKRESSKFSSVSKGRFKLQLLLFLYNIYCNFIQVMIIEL